MRQGQVFKRCTHCNTRVPERMCPKCGVRDTFTWAYVVDTTPKDAAGRLIGKRRQTKAQGFATRAAAQAALNELQVEKAAGTHVDPSRMTLGEYLGQWHADAKAHGWDGNTPNVYGVAIRRHLVPYLGTVRLQALTTMQIRGHLAWLGERGKIRRNSEGEITYQGPLSPKAVADVHVVLRAALNDAVAADPPLLRRNVAVGAYTYNRRKNRPEMLTWTVEEVRTFLDFTAQEPDHVLWWAALMTGMRRGELLGLRRRDLLLDRVVNGQPAPALNVRQQYAREPAGLRFRGLKTGSTAWRTIDLDEDTADALRGHVEAQEFQRRSWGPAYGNKCPRCGKQVEERCAVCDVRPVDLDLVFCHPDGSPFDPDTVTGRFVRRTGACSGVIRIRFHDQRHTHATLLLEDGETERYVAERLGDTVEMVHQTYGHVTPRMRAAAVKRLAARLAAPATVRDRSVTELDSTAVVEGGAP